MRHRTIVIAVLGMATTATAAAALARATPAAPVGVEPRSAAGWGSVSFHKLPSAASALRCGADQHGYSAVGVDNACPVPLAECRQMLNRTLMGNGTWDVVGFGGDGRWSWLSAAYSCTFFVASVPGTEGMNFTIGSEDVRNAVSYAVDNFDLGDGTLNTTRGFISGCPGAIAAVEWVVYDRQNQPIGLPPR